MVDMLKKKYIVEYTVGVHNYVLHPCSTMWEAKAIASQVMLIFKNAAITIVEEVEKNMKETLINVYRCVWKTYVGGIHCGPIRLTEEEALIDLQERFNIEQKGFMDGKVVSTYIPASRVKDRF